MESAMKKKTGLKARVPVPVKKRVTPPTQNMEAPFGVVGRMDSAPVNIGNTVRSVKPVVRATADGAVVTGRDYVQTLFGVSTTYTGWVVSGGFPLTPAALTATGLRGYFLSHELFRIRRLAVHYVTSSPTSLAGDILIVHHYNRGGPYVDMTSSNFLSYCMSTPSAIIGPQWVNKSVEIDEVDTYGWIPTDLFNSEDVEHQSAGEVIVYSKNTTNGANADQPGYILIDYHVEFKKRMLNPRSTTLPTNLMKFWISSTAINLTPSVNQVMDLSFGGATYDGSTGIAPPGVSQGMIFKIGLDTSLSSLWVGITRNTFGAVVFSRGQTGSIVDQGQFVANPGCTLYGVYTLSGTLTMYATYDAALSGNALTWGTTLASVATIPMWMTLVGSTSNAFTQSSI